MERIHHLIEKLWQQKNENANPEQLLVTIQLLQAELAQHKSKQYGTTRVAVTMPVQYNFTKALPGRPSEMAETKEKEQIVVAPEAIREELVMEMPTHREKPTAYTLRKPAIFEEPVVQSVPALEEVATPRPATQLTAFAAPAKEVHELLATKEDSLNDRLKEEKVELVHKLKETPIKDLRKAIGINDRFAFINELFKGDEPMYERSLKTINNFNIYSEAEFWIRRELLLKLAWNEDNATVRHFYELVRRRFS